MNRNKIRLPRDVAGPERWLVIAFDSAQQAECDRVRQVFDAWAREQPQPDRVRLMEIPVIEAPRPLRILINSGMRDGIPDPVKRGQVVTAYVDLKAWMKSMNLQEKSVHILQVSPDGRVLVIRKSAELKTLSDWTSMAEAIVLPSPGVK